MWKIAYDFWKNKVIKLTEHSSRRDETLIKDCQNRAHVHTVRTEFLKVHEFYCFASGLKTHLIKLVQNEIYLKAAQGHINMA